jgi:hypothetical protein
VLAAKILASTPRPGVVSDQATVKDADECPNPVCPYRPVVLRARAKKAKELKVYRAKKSSRRVLPF